MANYTTLNSQVTSQAAAMTLAIGRAKSWNPGAVLKLFSVVAIRADYYLIHLLLNLPFIIESALIATTENFNTAPGFHDLARPIAKVIAAACEVT